jgi:hypothetical protein
MMEVAFQIRYLSGAGNGERDREIVRYGEGELILSQKDLRFRIYNLLGLERSVLAVKRITCLVHCL